MNNNINIGEKIYTLRTKKNMSQTDLANEVDVSRQSISKWETGTATPDLDKLIKLSKIFEVSLDELVGNETDSADKDSEPVLMTQEQVDVIVADIKKEYSKKTPILYSLLTILGGIFILQGSVISAISSFILIPLSLIYVELGLILISVSNKKAIKFSWLAISIFTSLLMTFSLIPNLFDLSSALYSISEFDLGLALCVLYIIMWAIAIYNKKGKFEKIFHSSLCVIVLQLSNFLNKAYWLINYASRYFDENELMVRDEATLNSYIISICLSFVVLIVMVAGVFIARKVYFNKKSTALLELD